MKYCSQVRYCSSCRLRRCFDMGMKVELVRTDEENERYRQLVETNRQRRQQLIQQDIHSPAVRRTLRSYFSFLKGKLENLEYLSCSLYYLERDDLLIHLPNLKKFNLKKSFRYQSKKKKLFKKEKKKESF